MEEVKQEVAQPQPQPQPQPQVQPQQIIINQQAPAPQKNGLGVAGFVLALLGVIFCWVPVLGWILWVLGLIFSIIGMFRRPKGLAIAGLVLSCIDLIVLIILAAFVGAALAL
jgi:hypothetical protein